MRANTVDPIRSFGDLMRTPPTPAAGDVLTRLQEEQKAWSLHNFGPHPAEHPLLGVVEEVGELSHAHLKSLQGIRKNEDHAAKKRDAVADIIIYLADYCTQEGIDLSAEVWRVWCEVRKRDWKKDPAKGGAA